MSYLLPVIASIVLCASTCEKMQPGDYHDSLGNKVNLLGAWTLAEVRYKTDKPDVTIFTETEGENNSLDGEMYSPDRLIIMYDPEVGKDPLEKAIAEYKAEILYDYNLIPGFAIRLPEGSDILKAIDYFRRVEGVVSVERDRIIRLTDPVRPRLEVM